MTGNRGKRQLRVLIVEDSENDALLLQRYLQRHGFDLICERVDTAAAMSAALENELWDIVVSDYVLPVFSGLEALRLLQERNSDLPCIIVSGKVGEDTAVAVMKAGARDYIMKNNMARLGPAVERELLEADHWRERARMTEELKNKEEALRVMRRIDQMKDEFIGMVSHEMRTPLTIIVGSLHTVLTEKDELAPEEQHSLLQGAYSEAESLSNILVNLIELARIQADKLQVSKQELAVKEIVETSVDKVRSYSTTCQFSVDCSPSLLVDADRLLLERVLLNLLDNAVKYSRAGGQIQVSCRKEPDHVTVSVRDHGKGIAPADQEKLFKPFSKLEDAGKIMRGTGMGLVVSRHLVEAQGGHIWVESQQGQGSTFSFTLPAA